MENSSSEELRPPSPAIAADLGEMQSSADTVSMNLPVKDLPLQHPTCSVSDKLHSNNANVKTEEILEILEMQNVLEEVKQSRSSEELRPPSPAIAADLGEMQSSADTVSMNLLVKDLPLQHPTCSVSDKLHSNNANVKTEEIPEILEMQNVLEGVKQSRSSEELWPPGSVIAADLGEMPSSADTVSTNLPMIDLPLQCHTSSSSDNLLSNNANVKTEEVPEILETQNVLEEVKQSRRKPRKTQRVIKVEEKQMITDDEDLVEYTSSPTIYREGTTVTTTAVIISPSHSIVNSDASAIVIGDSLVKDDAVQALFGEPVDMPSGKDVPLKRVKRERGCLTSVIHCTACNRQIGVTANQMAYAHPVLMVLICKKCYKWYSSDEIEKGADGMDEQCRWCSEGGDLICCDFCHNAFCKSCIRRNLGRKALMDIVNAGDGSKWSCYICDSKPILHLVEQCTSIIESLTMKKKNGPTGPRQKGMQYRKKGTQLKGVDFELEPPDQSLFNTSNSLAIQLPSSVTKMRQRKPARISHQAVNQRDLSVDMVENAPGEMFLPSYQMPSFMPTFPGPFGTTLSLQAAPSAVMTSGKNRNYQTIETSVEMLDFLLTATTSMLHVLTLLQDELRLVGGGVAGFMMPLVTEERHMIATRLWSAQRMYMRMFQNAINEETPVEESVGEHSYTNTFQRDNPKLKRRRVGRPVGSTKKNFQKGVETIVKKSVGQRSYSNTFQRDNPELKRRKVGRPVGSTKRKFRRCVETIDLTGNNDELIKKWAPLSTVSSNPFFSNYDGGAGGVSFGTRLADNVHGLFKSDCKLSEATKTPLVDLPGRHRRKRKYPMTAS